MQRTVNLATIQASYMWTEDDSAPRDHEMMKSGSTYPMITMPNKNSDESTNQADLKSTINPRPNHPIYRQSSKISPHPNNFERQGASEPSNKHALPRRTTASNVSLHENQTRLYQTNPSTAIDSRQTSNISKNPYRRAIKYASIVACVLVIAAIVVPIAILFGLPKTSGIGVATTATKTTTLAMVALIQPNDAIMGVYGTQRGGSTGGSNGNYPNLLQTPVQGIDGLLTTKYVNFGLNGSLGYYRPQPGVNTGFYVTPTISSRSIARALLFATANDLPQRDPLTVTLEGTNATNAGALNLGSSWLLLYSGPTGIDPINIPSRFAYGSQQNFSNNILCSSYRLLVTSQRNDSDCVQYAEVQIFGYI